MTNRIDETFEKLLNRGEKALIAYIMAGDPNIEKTLLYLQALVKGGADIVEIGMPFSDPIADGPVIQKAAQRALKSDTNIKRILGLAKHFRQTCSTPIILMGYFNPVLRYGIEKFFYDGKRSGIDGVILPDLPLEEIKNIKSYADQFGIYTILLAAPTSGKQRLTELAGHTNGFLYYISLTGVTGSSNGIDRHVLNNIQWLRKHTRIPVAVGFGISTPQQAKKIARIADGIVVGSAFVKLIKTHTDASNELVSLARILKSAVTCRRKNR